MNINELVNKYATKVPLEVKNEMGAHLAISANCYLFSSSDLMGFVAAVQEESRDAVLDEIRKMVQ